MNNELNNEKINIEKLKKNIKDDLLKIKKDYENNIVNCLNLYNLNVHLNEAKLKNNKLNDINELFTIKYLFFFRIVLLYDKSMKIIILQILKNCIKINPLFTNKMLDAMIPIVICKIFEDDKNSTFDQRYECLKLFLIWLKLSDANFPIIFPQAVASLCKSDDPIKIGCIEFLRLMSILRPDLCSTVGGFKILITSMIEEKLPKNLMKKIIFTLVYIVNNTCKRKYFNGFGDFNKIFSIFTKSDFSSGIINKTEIETTQKKEEKKEETKKLEMQLDSAIYIIKKLLCTWPGYFLIMNDKMSLISITQSLNNDVNIIIKKSILKLFKDILELGYNILDNFNIICSEDKDLFYINKIYLTHIIQGLYDNKLNENLYRFIENCENNELRELSIKIAIKFNILFTKLSNYDVHSPFLKTNMEVDKWIDNIKYTINSMKSDKKTNNNINLIEINSILESEKQNKVNRVKITHLLNKVFYHLNCKDTPSLKIESLSTEIIIAVHGMLNLDYIKQYENQYSIATCRNELYSKDEELFIQLLKTSKVIELKEYHLWDWTQINSLLDLVEIKKELIPELNKQKFFKKLLFSYSPSKNLITKQTWIVNNFFYGAIGNKLFKILVEQEYLLILDTPNEDTLFQKSNSWIKDVMQCMDNLLDKNISEDHPFSIKRIYNTLSRNIFIFIGIISNSGQGDDYLNKQGFYSLLDKFINQSNKFDYLLTIIIDNLNFNSKYVNNWIKKVLEKCNNQIKKYVLNHIHCLLVFGKEIIIDVKMLLKTLDPDFPDRNKIIISIIKILINKGKNISYIFKDQSMIEKVKQIDKSLLHILMRDSTIYDYLIDIINKEVDNININEIVEKYGDEMTESMIETFTNKNKKKYYLTINLSKINNQYHHYYEYFWIKQLPLNIVIQTTQKKDKTNEYILNNYFDYNDDHNIVIIGQPQESQKIIFDDSLSNIQLTCFFGKIIMSKNCNSKNNASHILSFTIKDILKEISPYETSKNIFIYRKEYVNFILKKNEKKYRYTLEKIFFIINIVPNIITSFKTPINLITELNNNKKGYEKLIEINAVEKLLSYFDKKNDDEIDKNSKKIKSSLWILVKLVLNNDFGEKMQNKYKILEKIANFYFSHEDCSMRGTILYLCTFATQNIKLRPIIKNNYVEYFFNTNIGYSTVKNSLFIDKSLIYENNKLDNDIDLIEYRIKLSPISQEIYNNITNLANNITFKQSNARLEEIYKTNNQYFLDVNLFVKIYAVLTKYKLKETTRKVIMFYFEKCIFSSEIALKSSQLLKSLGDNLLNAHKL